VAFIPIAEQDIIERAIQIHASITSNLSDGILNLTMEAHELNPREQTGLRLTSSAGLASTRCDTIVTVVGEFPSVSMGIMTVNYYNTFSNTTKI
jgi:hypothetical protein